ncbi:hypothetical protein Tco_1394591 [Tanacetum coccineum]
MLNPNPDTGIDFVLNVETTSLVDVPVTSQATTTLPQPSNPLIPPVQQTPTPILATTPSSSLFNLPNFGSLFGFDDHLKRLEADFSELKQTNQYATTLSSIPNIVDNYLGYKLKESADKIMKEQVNTRVKKEVSKILLRIEKLVNEQLESEKNLYKALVDTYAADKDLLDAYGDTVTIKRRQDEADDDQEPSARTDQGSKRRRAGKEPESSSARKETTSKSTGKSTEGSKSRQ